MVLKSRARYLEPDLPELTQKISRRAARSDVAAVLTRLRSLPPRHVGRPGAVARHRGRDHRRSCHASSAPDGSAHTPRMTRPAPVTSAGAGRRPLLMMGCPLTKDQWMPV